MELNLAPNTLHPESQSFAIDKYAALIGENGCGKSSILQAIFESRMADLLLPDWKVVCFSSGHNERYSKAFESFENVRVLAEPNGCRSNYWLQTLILDEELSKQQEPILSAINEAGFMMRPAWTPMHQLQPYRDSPRMPLSTTQSLGKRVLNLPSSAALA